MLYLIQEKELKPVSVRNCGVRLQYIQNYVREHFREIGIDILEKKPIPYIQMYKDGVTQRLQAHESSIGKPFGLLKVIGKDSSKDKDARRVWKCVCKCGNVVYASRTELTHGYRTHCGDREKHNGKELWQGE